MNWVLHLLGSHPEVQSKVQQELQEVFGNVPFSCHCTSSHFHGIICFTAQRCLWLIFVHTNLLFTSQVELIATKAVKILATVQRNSAVLFTAAWIHLSHRRFLVSWVALKHSWSRPIKTDGQTDLINLLSYLVIKAVCNCMSMIAYLC